MAPYLGQARPFYGLITPSYERKPTPYPHVEAIAADYVRAVRACQPSGPYFLIEECYRGIVVFEMAQQLIAQGQEVALLVLVDVRRPTQTRYRRYLARKNLLSRIINPNVAFLTPIFCETLGNFNLPVNWC
ncbi:MAG: thioesterase domain-containing protein [Xenococcaceae cyanobacterium]